MADEKYNDDVLVLTSDSWHGKHDLVLDKDTPVEDGCNASRMEEIEWVTKPLYVEIESGKFVPFGSKKALVRPPHFRAADFHIITSRTVKDYTVISNDFLVSLTKDLARHTGWQFEGCGTLRHNEISFVQLRLSSDVVIGGREYERHKVNFFYGDDKGGGSGFGGFSYTRIECANTWRAAINEDGVLKIPHIDNPEARWKFINAQAILATKIFREQNAMLDRFYTEPLTKGQLVDFLDAAFPKPKPRKAMFEAMEAKKMIKTGDAGGYDLTKILDRGHVATVAYNNELALIERKRTAVKDAFDEHNARYPHSANTFYAAFQGLTYPANHSNLYRGDALTGILFGGRRGLDIKRGYNVLVEMLG